MIADFRIGNSMEAERETLNRVNQAEADLWSVFAQHHEFNGHTLVYDLKSPTSLWSNSIYPKHINDRFQLTDADMLETFYQVHGLEGFLRDFHGDFATKSLARFSYFYFDPATAIALASPPALKMHRCGAGELGAFAEDVRLCYGYGKEYVHTFHERMGKLMTRYPSSFFRFTLNERTAGVASLVRIGGISRLLHFGVHPELRKRGYGVEVLNSVLAASPEPVFTATEIPKIAGHLLPAAGFRCIGMVDMIPLLSLLR